MEGLHPARLARLDTKTDCLSEDDDTLSHSYQRKTGANTQPLGPRGSRVSMEISYENRLPYDKQTTPPDALEEVRQNRHLNHIHGQSMERIVAQEDEKGAQGAFAESLDELIAGVRNAISPGNKPSIPLTQPTGEKDVGFRPSMKREPPICEKLVSNRGSPAPRGTITSVASLTTHQDGVNKRKYEPSHERTRAIDIYSLPPGGLRRRYIDEPQPKTPRTEMKRPGNTDLSRPPFHLRDLEHENISSKPRRVDPGPRTFQPLPREFSRHRDDLTRSSYVPREDRMRRRAPDTVSYIRQSEFPRPPRAHGAESTSAGGSISHKWPSRSEIAMPRVLPLNTPFKGSIYLDTKLEDVEKEISRPWEPERAIMWVGGGYNSKRGSVVTVVQKSLPHSWTAHVFCLSNYQASTSNDTELWAIIKALEMAYDTNETRTLRYVVYSHCQNGLMMLERNEQTRDTGLIDTMASRSQLIYEQGKRLELHWISKKHDTGCTAAVAAANTAVTNALSLSMRQEHELDRRPIIFTGTSLTDLIEATRKWLRSR